MGFQRGLPRLARLRRMSPRPETTAQTPTASIATMKPKNSHKGTMFSASLSDLLTYANILYLLSLLVTFILTASLWRISVAVQTESDAKLDKYKIEAAARIAEADLRATQANTRAAEANAAAEVARKDAAVALAAAAIADQKAAEAREAAAVADQKGAEAKLAAAAADERAARANERAVAAGLEAGEANRGVSKITTRRSITQSQAGIISSALKRNGGTQFTLSINEAEPDNVGLASQIIGILSHAGWEMLDWNRVGDSRLVINGRKVGSFPALGVQIVYFPDESSKYYQAAKNLASALNKIGLAAVAQGSSSTGGTNQDALLIEIGAKVM